MGKRVKIVVDTNVYISALGWNGNERKLINQCIDGKYEYYISRQIYNELRRVMDYPKFAFTDSQKEEFISALLDSIEFINVDESIQIVNDDPDDNKFLECAIAAEADFIITGDPHLQELKHYQKIKIFNAHDFLEKMKGKI